MNKQVVETEADRLAMAGVCPMRSVAKQAKAALRMLAASSVLVLPLILTDCVSMQKPILTSADQDDLARITAYLNGIPRFEAHFTQIGSYGPGAGLIWLDRPGHLRIDYAGAGARVMVIADGRVRILDRATGALTTMPVSRTPLGLLLAPTVSLAGAAHLDSVAHENGGIRLVLSKAGQPTRGRLTLDFADRPLVLQAVTVTDAYQRMLTMRLTDIDAAPMLTPDLFQPPSATPSG